MKTETIKVGYFKDKNGRKYQVLEICEIHEYAPLKGGRAQHKGFSEYKTSCGIHINFKNGVYTTIDGLVLEPENGG